MSNNEQNSEDKLCFKSQDLKLLLQRRKSKIGRKKFIGITELISSLALIISLCFVDFGGNPIISIVLRVVFIVIAAFLFIFYFVQLVISFK